MNFTAIVTNPRFFPTILIALDVAAAVVWYTHGDYRKVVYWAAAAVLTVTVTY